jgi:integrase
MGIFLKDGKWYIDYRYEGRRIRECVGPSKREAENALAACKGEIVQGRYHFKKRGNVHFDDFAKTYLEYAKTDKISWATDEYRLKHLLPFFGNRLLDDITPFYIANYKKKRAEVVKKATVNRELNLLKRILSLAVTWGKATANHMRDVRLFREDPVPVRILSQEEISKILGACTEYSRPIILAALMTGMRRGEILGLKWEQVDMGERVITVLHPKNGKVRMIPINDILFETLKVLKKKATSESVFVCVRTGEPAHVFRTAWLNILKRAGITHLRLHDLRHNFATHLLRGGVDPGTVRDLLGHSSLLMLGKYVHSAPESKRQAVAVLERRLTLQDAECGHFLDTKPILEKKAILVSR